MDDDFWGTVVGLLILGGIVYVVLGWNDDGWVGKARYAFSYDVPLDQVEFARKPHDCDWSSAPIGAKHCSYEAVARTYNAAGQLLVWAKSEDHVFGALVGGKLVPLDDVEVSRVTVEWNKVQD